MFRLFISFSALFGTAACRKTINKCRSLMSSYHISYVLPGKIYKNAENVSEIRWDFVLLLRVRRHFPCQFWLQLILGSAFPMLLGNMYRFLFFNRFFVVAYLLFRNKRNRYFHCVRSCLNLEISGGEVQ